MPAKSSEHKPITRTTNYSEILPEFGDAHAVFLKFGIKFGFLYILARKHLIRSILVPGRGRGKNRGKRLYDLASIRDHLNSLQNREEEALTDEIAS
jgi:hypothetical protein